MTLSDIFYYCETSPTFLRWKISTGRAIKDSVAGRLWVHPDKPENRYFIVSHKGKNLKVHRVIWELFNGYIPKNLQIDHIDGQTTINNIENLRVVSASVNNKNKRKDKRNSSGFTGVSWTKTKENNTYCTSAITCDGVVYRKHFNAKIYGIIEAQILAVQWRIKQLTKLDPNFKLFTERHGK